MDLTTLRPSSVLALVLAAVVTLPGPAGAEPLTPDQIPASLAPWVPWVLRGHRSELCPPLVAPGADGLPRICAWAGRLSLALDARGGRFSQSFHLATEAEVPLPGDADRWPLDVRSGGRRVPVLDAPGGPALRLPAGEHQVTGVFVWPRLPELLPVPASTGLVTLTLGGRAVPLPRRGPDGALFLASSVPADAGEADRLEVTVHRKLSDGVPLLLVTRIALAVAGKPREVVLAAPLPAGFVSHALAGDLPARLDPDGKLRVELRAGTHEVTVTGRAPTPLASIVRPQPNGVWSAGAEIWVFEARPELRVVSVTGVPAVDTRQGDLPPGWQNLPAHLVRPGATVRLEERHRGAAAAPDRLSLRRRLWLDFDGGGYTVRDQVQGRLERGTRLEVGAAQQLGRAVVEGVDQPITQLAGDGRAGIEVRKRDVAVVAEGRIVGQRAHPPAVGWAHDFQSVEATLSLPPGWQLVHGSGADRIGGTWLRGFSLLDLFLVLVVALASARLFGLRVGVLALVTMVLIVQETAAPAWAWLALLLGEALVRALPAGHLRRAAKIYRGAAAAVLIVLAVPFALGQVRRALHPAASAAEAQEYGGASASLEMSAAGAARSERMMKKEARQVAPSSPAPRRIPAPQRSEERAKVAAQARDMDAPAPPPAPHAPAEVASSLAEAEEDDDDVEGGVEGGVAGGVVGGSVGGTVAREYRTSLTDYDPDAEVQTGPGLPRWQWTDVPLQWNGPVAQAATLSLWLLPPWLTLLLGLVRIVLVAALLFALLRGALGSVARFLPPVAALLLAALPSTSARAAEFPPQSLLDELRGGLTALPTCHPRCASFGRLLIDAGPTDLRLRLEADAQAPAAVALPGLAAHWIPAVVTVDGRPTSHVHRDSSGRLWLLLPAGAHQIVLEGPLPARASIQLPFGPQRPHQVTATLRGFTLLGVAEDGRVGDSLELVRVAATDAAAQTREGTAPSLPPFVSVERTLILAVEWRMRTEVMRTTPPGAAVVIEIPLLPGESVLTPGIKVAGGKVQVNLGPDDARTSWLSAVAQKSPITLEAAPMTAGYAEVWRLDAGPIWHVEPSGIPEVEPGRADSHRVRTWRPWPGEKVSLAVVRPAGKKGQTVTVDVAALELVPGERSTRADLTVELRASRGGEHTFVLPEGARLTNLATGGRELPLRQEGRRVVVPITPGTQQLALRFDLLRGLDPIYRTPAVDVGGVAAHSDLVVRLGENRWVLWTRGPRLGPAVLMPTALLFVLLVVALLGRAGVLPLPTLQFLVLALGLVPLSIGAAALVIGFFVALSWRRTHLRTRHAWVHDGVQLALGLWALAAVVVLFVMVRDGLLAAPDMQVAGNGSTAELLHWTADRTGGGMPVATVLSLPLGAYHLAMLGWALWLAVTMIRWAPWIWSCVTAGGLWQPLRPARPEPPAAPPTP